MNILPATTNIEEVFQKRNVDNYFGFIEGDYEPSLGKTIKSLIIANEAYIVYLDEDDFVEWTYNGKYEGGDKFFEKFGLVINKIGLLEVISKDKLEGIKLSAFRRLLGESMARLLNEKNDKNALVILKTAEDLLNTQSRQKVIKSAAITTVSITFLSLLLWFLQLKFNFLDTNYEIFFYATLFSMSGALGGFIFLMLRSKSFEIEPSLETVYYAEEGVLRIAYGIICAFVIYLAINAKFIMGNIENPEKSITTLLACILSGASERIIPGLIKKIETKI